MFVNKANFMENKDFEKGFKSAIEYIGKIEDDLFDNIMGCHNSEDRVLLAYQNNCKTLLEWVEIGGYNI